jgi:phospholipid N-methyltransferase
MISCVDFNYASTIVELGAGTGAITNELLRRSSPNNRILIIDLNQDAISLLRERLKENPNVEVVLADARTLDTLLKKRNIERVEAIFSSLPYATLGTETTREILANAAGILAPNGHFVAFQYTPLFKNLFEAHFSIRSSKIEFRNLPPAIVYDCVSKTEPHVQAHSRKTA